MRVFRFFIAGMTSVGWLAITASPSAGMGGASTPRSASVTSVAPTAFQTRTITGTVTDSVSGDPVIAGQVLVVGTTMSALIHPDGRFTISVSVRAVTLQIRSIGYQPRTIQVAAEQSTVRVALARDNFRLQEVVISGQATGMEKKNMATAVGTVDAADIAQVPASSVDRALEGKVSGTHISENSGAPGGGSIVRIRGVTTIIGNFTPLYVVDGVVVSDVQLATGTNFLTQAIRGQLAPTVDNQDNGANRIADLNSYDIEKVEVLKGAAASAIYGSKASNGVILITTKRGQQGATQFSITQRFGTSELSHKYGLRCFTSANEAVSVFGEAARASWQPRCLDWEQQFYGAPANSYETSVNMRGGSELTRFFASALNKHDAGVMLNTGADKKSLRLNVDQNVGSRVTLGLNSEFVQSVRNPGVTQNENNGLATPSAFGYSGASWLDLRKLADGTYPRNPVGTQNQFQTSDLFKNREEVNRGIISFRLGADLWHTDKQALRLSMTGGADFFTQKNVVIAPPGLYALEGSGLPGSSVLGYAQNTNTNLNTYLVHDYHLPHGGLATGQIGMQIESVDLDESFSLTQGLIGGLTNIDRGLAVNVEEHKQRIRDEGFFGQEEVLLLDEKLLLTAGVRADRSTNNSDPAKLFIYPKASVSYRMPNLTRDINELKLRLAVGQSGNQPRYGQKFTELTATNLGGLVPTSQLAGSAAALDLRPERQQEIETGFDATLLKSRVNIEVTVYQKAISDLLEQRTLTPGSGLARLFFNGGNLRTRGLELAATVVAIEGRGWNWKTRMSLSGSRCIITALPVAAYTSTAFLNGNTFGQILTQVGGSCTQITGNDTIANGKTVRNVPLRDANPDYNWTWSHDVSWRNWRLNALLDGQKGGAIINVTGLLYDLTGISPDQLVPKHPGWLTGDQRAAAFGRTARTYVQDISFVKLREITLSYDIPRPLVQRMWARATTGRISLSGRNLLTITNYQSTGDPEVNQVSRSAAGGAPWDLWAYPPSRTFWFSVDFGF